MSDRNETVADIGIIFLLVCLGFIIGIICGVKDSEEEIKEYQRQAVSNNFAYWTVDDAGKTEFKWNIPSAVTYQFKSNTPYYFHFNSTGVVELKLQKE